MRPLCDPRREVGADGAPVAQQLLGGFLIGEKERALAAAARGVEPRTAGGDALRGDPVIEVERSDRQHREPALADNERVFVRAVRRAAILQYAQPPPSKSYSPVSSISRRSMWT